MCAWPGRRKAPPRWPRPGRLRRNGGLVQKNAPLLERQARCTRTRTKKRREEMTTAAAEYGVITEAGAIRFERLLPGPIERVWEYLVDPDKRRTWLADGPMAARAGGQIEYIWRN